MTSPEHYDEAKAREAAARQRFIAINVIRMSGIALVMFGFLIMMQRFGWVQGGKAKAMGSIIATVGIIQAIIIPRALLRAWRTPKP